MKMCDMCTSNDLGSMRQGAFLKFPQKSCDTVLLIRSTRGRCSSQRPLVHDSYLVIRAGAPIFAALNQPPRKYRPGRSREKKNK